MSHFCSIEFVKVVVRRTNKSYLLVFRYGESCLWHAVNNVILLLKCLSRYLVSERGGGERTWNPAWCHLMIILDSPGVSELPAWDKLEKHMLLFPMGAGKKLQPGRALPSVCARRTSRLLPGSYHQGLRQSSPEWRGIPEGEKYREPWPG